MRRRHGAASQAGFRPLFAGLLVLLSIASCAAHLDAARPVAHLAPQARENGLAVLLVAGDASAHVFDNAVFYLRDELRRAGVLPSRLHLLTADNPLHGGYAHLGTLAGAVEAPADLAHVLAAIRALKPPEGGACFVFLTSHGVEGEGLYLGYRQEVLAPDTLDAALLEGCGTAPTAVVVSGCYAGAFAKAPMARENRIVITASAADRSSFGCSSNDVLTYFDDCLLGALAGARTWRGAFEDTRQCVALREDQSEMEPSQPQAWFGLDVTDLATPWQAAGEVGDEVGAIRFTPGEDAYAPKLVPISREDRQVMASVLKDYAEAATPKALAYVPFGFVATATPESDPDASPEDMARLALQRCEWLTGGGCILFARDDRTVARLPAGMPPYHPPTLRRDGRLTAAGTPFIRDAERPQIARYLALPGAKALALSPEHDTIAVGQGVTVDAARDAALQSCRIDGVDCIVYAEGDRVVLGW